MRSARALDLMQQNLANFETYNADMEGDYAEAARKEAAEWAVIWLALTSAELCVGNAGTQAP